MTVDLTFGDYVSLFISGAIILGTTVWVVGTIIDKIRNKR